MPEPKRPLKVFLCHAHADRDSVRALPAGARLTNDQRQRGRMARQGKTLC